ncbi:MAG: hypothetical protein ACJ790_07100 [Myxococcaceae bacterium]
MRSAVRFLPLVASSLLFACGGSQAPDVVDSGTVDTTPPPPCPIGTSRSCYSGPTGTEGVGACHGGAQQCSASGWSNCEGEVIPKLEACNGLDDDCEGHVDEGCPVAGALKLSRYPSEGSFFGNATGNATTTTRSTCPDGTLVRGFIGAATETFDRLGLACGAPSIVEDSASSPFVYSVAIADAGTVASVGGIGGTDFQGGLSCPPNQIVTGISVWDDAQTAVCPSSACTGGASSSTCAGLYGIQISCSELEVEGAPGSYVVRAKAGGFSSGRVASGNANRPTTESSYSTPIGAFPYAADFASGPWPVYCPFTAVNGVRLVNKEPIVETK